MKQEIAGCIKYGKSTLENKVRSSQRFEDRKRPMHEDEKTKEKVRVPTWRMW